MSELATMEPRPAEDLDRGPLTGTLIPVTQQIALPGRVEWRQLAGVANTLASSGILGKHLNGRPKAVMAVILKGRELGLPPMEALNSIYIIEGVPTLSAHLMLALVRRAGHDAWWDEDGTEGRATLCSQRLRRDGSYSPHIGRSTWTLDMAYRAKLVAVDCPHKPKTGSKSQGGCGCRDNWVNYPAAMLRARAVTALCRMEFSDVLMGAVYSPEELGADVDAEGTPTRLPSPAEAQQAAGALTEAGRDGETAPLPPQDPVHVDDDVSADLGPDVIEATAEPVVLNRAALWEELLTQARVVGQSLRAYTNRWSTAHKRNIEEATNVELHAFVESRRGYIGDYLAEHPDAVSNTPVGKQPDCPPDPEASAEGPEVRPADSPPEGAEPADADPPPGFTPADEPGAEQDTLLVVNTHGSLPDDEGEQA